MSNEMKKHLKYAGRSLSVGELCTETCSVCEETTQKVIAVHKTMAMVECQNCKNSSVIERPILFRMSCPPTATV